MDNVTVSNNENPSIDVEIVSYTNKVDIAFVQSIEAAMNVHNCNIGAHSNIVASLTNAISQKVDSISGKGLSANDFSDEYKNELTTTYAQTHTHSNKSVLDDTTVSFTTTYASQVTTTYAQAHTHSNKTTLDAISATPADYNLSNLTTAGKAVISNLAMPSGSYTNLTLGASGSTYTAPADGYFISDFSSNMSSGDWVVWYINNVWYHCNNATAMYLHMGCIIPVKKDAVLKITYYSTTPSTHQLRFYYAQGEV